MIDHTRHNPRFNREISPDSDLGRRPVKKLVDPTLKIGTEKRRRQRLITGLDHPKTKPFPPLEDNTVTVPNNEIPDDLMRSPMPFDTVQRGGHSTNPTRQDPINPNGKESLVRPRPLDGLHERIPNTGITKEKFVREKTTKPPVLHRGLDVSKTPGSTELPVPDEPLKPLALEESRAVKINVRQQRKEPVGARR